MEEITSFIITRHSEVYYDYVVNDNPLPEGPSGCTGYLQDDFIIVKSITGAPQTKRVHFSVIEYYDTTNPDNNLTNPVNAQEMMRHLVEQNFLKGSSDNSGGGGSLTTAFKSLTDVNVPTFFGNAGKMVVVAGNEEYLILVPASSVQNFKDLHDVNITEYIPNSYILTNSTGTALIQAPVQQIINRPFAFNEAGVTHKGATDVDGVIVPNEENYTPEIGDAVTFFAYDAATNRLYKYSDAEWLGGSMDDPANYDWGIRTVWLEDVIQ